MDSIERFCSFYFEYNAISEQRRTMVRRVLRDCASQIGRDLAELTAPELSHYLETLVADGLMAQTVGGRLYAIRPFLKWAWREKLIPAERYMELCDVEPPRGSSYEPDPSPYTRKQIAQFWREVERKYPLRSDHEKWMRWYFEGKKPWRKVQRIAKRYQLEAMTALALSGGLRRDEIWNIPLDNLEPDAAYVVVVGARKNRDGTPKPRAVPWTTPWMHAAVSRFLAMREQLAPDHDHVWLSLHQDHFRKPMQYRTYEVLLRQVPPGWSFQRFRHTAATEMLRADYPLEQVQVILGHAKIQQTLAYAKIIPDDVVHTANRVEAIYTRAIAPPTPETVAA